jgi:hypothetical protein
MEGVEMNQRPALSASAACVWQKGRNPKIGRERANNSGRKKNGRLSDPDLYMKRKNNTNNERTTMPRKNGRSGPLKGERKGREKKERNQEDQMRFNRLASASSSQNR